jgi:hypothetical protein
MTSRKLRDFFTEPTIAFPIVAFFFYETRRCSVKPNGSHNVTNFCARDTKFRTKFFVKVDITTLNDAEADCNSPSYRSTN